MRMPVSMQDRSQRIMPDMMLTQIQTLPLLLVEHRHRRVMVVIIIIGVPMSRRRGPAVRLGRGRDGCRTEASWGSRRGVERAEGAVGVVVGGLTRTTPARRG